MFKKKAAQKKKIKSSKIEKSASYKNGGTKTKDKKNKLQKVNSEKRIEFRIGDEIWPVERDILYRPDRLKYVRKLIKTDGCVFCKTAQSQICFESLLIYKSKYSMTVMNKFPYNPGHVLILPQRHCGSLLELSDAEFLDLNELVRKTFHAVEKAYSPSGVNIGLNHGAVAGAGIPDHLHYHIVPRWTGDMNFFPLIAETKALPSDLESSYQLLHKAFEI